ncbi:ATP-binding protein [Belnapia rosea]|uniref:histidine kinase n=1 Tax=Belnapia rosea TaxID=938405 RepID=A0A1G7BUE7_9PROT|nr:ATP-binding protein [Belnapia rosea]SDE30627.1 Bacteriophytochrome (light-regulated signal transduction histidine kinase) [Belnapia rosea]
MTPLDRAPLAADPTAGCDREPIHVPGSIQPHGHLLAFAGDHLVLTHASAGAGAVLSTEVAAAFGRPIGQVLAGAPVEAMRDGLHCLPETGPMQLGRFRAASGTTFQAIGHRSPCGHTLLEFEAEAEKDGLEARATLEALYPGVRDAFARLGRATSIEVLGSTAAAAVRRITGFDRVLVYRFEENWDGTVVAEDSNGRLPAYLGLRFPASDIPAQARRLYEANPQRLIADADYAPVPILPARPGDASLDLTFAGLRSVSPVHLEYMRNMGTPASMSVSILRADGRLWGLVSCHHAAPRRVPFAARNACDLVAQMFAVRVAAREEMAYAEARTQLKGLEGRLLARMAAVPGRLEDGLLTVPADLLDLTGAAGAAVLTEGGCVLAGATPAEDEVRRIASWLAERRTEEVFQTNSLSELLPGAEGFADIASGLLAVPVSRLHPSFVLWFRPEVVRTVTWGGDPRKPAEPSPDRLHPRRSFAAWAETVRLRSAPWSAAEVEAARDLRNAIVSVVLRGAEERAELTDRLERVNKELAAFSYSVSHDLRAPFRHIVGFAELLRESEGSRLSERGQRYVATITEAAETAGRLVDALLNFSQMGRTALAPVEFDPMALVIEVRRALQPEQAGRHVEWRIGPMPVVWADPIMLRQVFQNLLSNAVKYTRGRDPAVIEVGCEALDGEFVFSVRDNGAGFDMAYAHKLFGVFQRLHRAEEFEGVGIGLANVQRIVERHGGRIWAEGRLGEGATFHFTLPRHDAPGPEAF